MQSMATNDPGDEHGDKEEHKRLARFVKGVHADLRKKFKSSNADLTKIWDDHCQNKQVLAQYADAMHHLALDHWSKQPESRILWCRDTAVEFFLQGGLKQVLEKEERRNKYHSKDEKNGTESISAESAESEKKESDAPKHRYNRITLPLQGKIRLLDVGSCYNPFTEFEEFLSIGIDISPAKPSVYYCDFLHLETSDPLQVAEDTMDTYVHNLKDPIERLPKQIFHVVVFSLLLEYFPSPYQRWLCCQKAHNLLMVDGLLLIITPDSHQQHRNAPVMKSWRLGIESMGFKRWRYIKLDHIHCMAFRKVETTEPENCLIGDASPDMLYIPQDFNDCVLDSDNVFCPSLSFTEGDENFYRQSVKELPFVAQEEENFP